MIRNKRVGYDTNLDDDSWNFMDVLDVQSTNYEYYNDIRDIDFDKRKSGSGNDLFAIVALIAILVLGAVVMLQVTGVIGKDDGYKEVLAMQSVNQDVNMSYVDGEEADSSELLEASNMLAAYFQLLATEQELAGLENFCKGSSSFFDTYNSNTEKVVTLYDSSDCYARALSRFASFCKCTEIVKLLKDNDTYYCYFKFSFPNTSDVQSFVHSNSYYLTKYFQGKELTEENIMRCFLEMTSSNGIGYHTEEYCVKMLYEDGNFRLVNDSFMVDICSNAYFEYLKQCSGYLGGNIIKK